jgi:hypothetical protein
LGIIPLAAGVVTTLRMSAKNSVQKLIDYTAYFRASSHHFLCLGQLFLDWGQDFRGFVNLDGKKITALFAVT